MLAVFLFKVYLSYMFAVTQVQLFDICQNTSTGNSDSLT